MTYYRGIGSLSMLVTGLGSSVLGKPTVNSAYNTLVSCVLKWTNKSDIRKKKKKGKGNLLLHNNVY